MRKAYVTSALAGAFLFGMATAALAVTGEYDNMCTMGLAIGKDIKTDCSINGQIGGKTYLFGSEEAKTTFMKDPQGNLAKAQESTRRRKASRDCCRKKCKAPAKAGAFSLYMTVVLLEFRATSALPLGKSLLLRDPPAERRQYEVEFHLKHAQELENHGAP